MKTLNTTKTFLINDKLFSHFEEICENKKIDKDKLLQKYISSFIMEHFEIKNKYFLLKNDDEYNPITITKKDKELLYLSDGNIINYSTFEKIYEETDPTIKSTIEYINETSPGNNKGISDEEFKELLKSGEKLKEDFKKPFIEQKKVDEFIKNIKINEILESDDKDSDLPIDFSNTNKLINDIKDMINIKTTKEILEIPSLILKNNVEEKLQNLNDEVWNVTRIFKIPGLKFTKDKNSLHCFIVNKDVYDKDELKEILTHTLPNIKHIDVFEHEEVIFSTNIIEDYRRLRGDYLIPYTDLGPLISKLFDTFCLINDFEGTYIIHINHNYFNVTELYTILFSNHIKMDSVVFMDYTKEKKDIK